MILAGVASILLIVVVGIFALIRFKQQSISAMGAEGEVQSAELVAQEEPEPLVVKEKPVALESIESADPLEQVVLRHFAATKVDQVTTLKLNAHLQIGETHEAQNDHEMIFYFRRPNFARRVMMQGDLRFDMGFDGNEIWAQQANGQGDARAMDELPEGMASKFKEASRLGSYLWRYEETPERFTLEKDTMLDGIACHVILYEDEKERVYTYIDQDSYWEIATEQHPKVGDSRSIAYMRMSEHQSANGVVMPMKIVTSSNGAVYSIVEIKQLEINQGVPSYIFEDPNVRYSAK